MNQRQIIRTSFCAGILTLLALAARAAVIVLNSSHADYTFRNGNTYYVTNAVQISGTATIEQGAVIKFAYGGQLVMNGVNCQTVATNPAILTGRDDDRFGDTLSDSTHAPSGCYGSLNPFQIYSVEGASVGHLRFYYLFNGLTLFNNSAGPQCENAQDLNYGLWDLWMENCDWGIDCEAVCSGASFLYVTNLTMIDCSGGIAGHYFIGGQMVNSTFQNMGSLVSDEWGYGFLPLNFVWCTFSNVNLSAYDVNVWGDHNGFADCRRFSIFDYNYGEYNGTNYFGDSWYWLSNSIIHFTLSSTNHYVNRQVVPVEIKLTEGTVFYQALLVNNTDFEKATWNNFATTNLFVDFGGLTNGIYDVWVGLCGARDCAPVWQKIQLEMDTNPPVFAITNPFFVAGITTSGVPLIQILGNANEELEELTYDFSNALSVATNQRGDVLQRFFDPVPWNFTTNYFQLFDLALTNGLNQITVHARDLAGNVSTTNLSVILDYSSRTNPPGVKMVFPTDGESVCATNFTADGMVDDPTAIVEAQLIDADGKTNCFTGGVERTGRFWLDNMPLFSGTNHLVVTITDAAGNVGTTNITVVHDPLTLTITPPSGMQLWNKYVQVTGMISDSTLAVWVNGVKGHNDGNGTWHADRVPVTEGGVASFTVEAYEPGEQQPDGSYGNPQ